MRRIFICCCVTAISAAVLGGQHSEHPLPADFDQPIRLYTVGLGTFTRTISTSSTEAQAYFNQGIQLMYAFAKAEAGRSFREAQKRDPTCAICFWGEAWAWGPYVNGRMTPAHAARAYAAIRKAVALADRHATDRERALIDAMAVRYVERFDPANRILQDRAYAEAMARASERYPDDVDASTLYAEALFLLLPRPGMFDLSDQTVSRMLDVLERALKRDRRHPGACHLYIHATELTAEPERAVPCAEWLGDAMPGASHLNHMPAHTFTRVGRWGDAVRAALRAWQSDQKASRGEGFATYPAHDLQMLAYAAAWDGQSSVALQAARGLSRVANDVSMHAFVLVRFGRFDDAASLGPRPSSDIHAGMWDFAQGYAALRGGKSEVARVALDRLRDSASTSKASFKFHKARSLLGVVAAILEGEIHRASGGLGAAIASFERSVSLQDSLIIDDPEPLPFAARHWLGAALLEATQYADAERVYREDLRRHPHNGWSLVGLRDALKGQGKATAASNAQLKASWARADIQITASRF